MSKAIVLCGSVASVALLLLVGGGCGSSSGGGGNSGSSSGTGSSSGVTSSGSSGGISSGSSSGTASGSSSGTASGSSSGTGSSSGAASDAGGDAASTCTAPTSAPPTSDVPPYTTVVPQLNTCSPAAISGFITACDSTTSSTTACDTWQNDSANFGCESCLLDASLDASAAGLGGGFLVDAAGKVLEPNLPGCIALADKTDGPACAAALEPLIQCQAFACGLCMNQTDADNCFKTVNAGACNMYFTPVQTACATDLADAGAINTTCSTDTDIINEICGTGS